MTNINDTLKERGSRYGTMEDNSNVTQELMNVLAKYGKNSSELSNIHWECIHQIFFKISRMVSGDCMYVDNAHDIVGYAKLLEDYLIKNQSCNLSVKERMEGNLCSKECC